MPALYLVGRRLFGQATALLAAAMLAVDTGAVWASQEARSYALLVLLTTISWWLLLRAAEARPGARAVAAWVLYLVAAALAVYAHFYAVLVLAAQGLVLCFMKLPSWRAGASEPPVRRRVPAAVIAGCGIASIAALWPLALFLARPHHNIDWIANGARGVHAALEVIEKPILHPTVTHARNELYVLMLTGPLAVFAAWGAAAVKATRWRWGLLLLWLGVPIICSLVVSVTLQPIIDPRYLTICLPPLCLLAAGALTQIWPRWPACAALTLLVVADIGSLGDYYRTTQNEDWRGVTDYVLAHAQPRCLVLRLVRQNSFRSLPAPARSDEQRHDRPYCAARRTAAVASRHGGRRGRARARESRVGPLQAMRRRTAKTPSTPTSVGGSQLSRPSTSISSRSDCTRTRRPVRK